MNEREIFTAALDRYSPEERRAYLDEACGNDLELRRRVEALLQSHEDAGDFLERPALVEEPGEAAMLPSKALELAGLRARAKPTLRRLQQLSPTLAQRYQEAFPELVGD